MAVKPIPDGYHAVTPYLIVEGADRFIEFCKQAFSAEEIMRMASDDGAIRHAEIRIGDSPLMVSDACDAFPAAACMMHLYVEDADATYRQAVAAGAASEREPSDQFYGDRTAGVIDPFGVRWYMATHIEDVPPEELQRRMKAQQ